MPYTSNNSIITGPIPSNDLWPTYGIPQVVLQNEQVTCEQLGGLADAVLDLYGIDYLDQAGVGDGGELINLDIKRMDAMTVVNMSLIEAGASVGAGTFVEPIVNVDGVVESRIIGGYEGLISDEYYQIVTGNYTESPKAVMVTAGRPLPTFKELHWYPIWGENATYIYTTLDMLNNCRKDDFDAHASIVFNDPQLDSDYEDGIDNLYEITVDNPWDRIVGYSKYINPTPDASKNTAINYNNSATVPIQTGTDDPGENGPNMGKLASRPTFKEDIYNPNCWTIGQDVDPTDGIKVNIPSDLRYTTIRGVKKDKFIRIVEVYAVGPRIQTMTFGPRNFGDSKDDPTKENAKLYVRISETNTTTTKLEPGKHYAVAYEELETDQPKIPYIVFTKDVAPTNPFDYGKDQTYYVDPTCEWAREQKTVAGKEYVGTVFPHSRYKGILVQELWVTIEIETPSITVFDPGVPGAEGTDTAGGNAVTIAENMEYYVAPMVVEEPPAPIAYSGPSTGGSAELVNQVPTFDNDPTTVQPVGESEMDTYMDEMQGGGLAVTWSFLDETNVKGACNALYNYLHSDVTETVWTCGPECEPLLGGTGNSGGVINAIRYSYTDGGSYTVSVTEGPKLIGNLVQVDGGPSAKMAENFSASGVVIDYAGDNIHFKLRIDGYGERWAINMTHRILRKNDVVQCTVHNNPMEA